MKQLLLIANWKSHDIDAIKWLQNFSTQNTHYDSNKKIIICPPFTQLEKATWYINSNNLPFKVGSQDISKFEEGPFTGEINGKILSHLVSYVIIGHSERREKFNETDQDVAFKASQARKYNLTPIVCVQNEHTIIPKDIEIVAYEPVFAIGSGTPDTPENAEEVAKKIKAKDNIENIIYGGSVASDNVASFTKKENISGVLVGSKSLDPLEFLNIIKNS